MGPDLDRLIGRSADPHAARLGLRRLRDLYPDLPARIEADPALARSLVAVLASCRALTPVLDRDPRALDCFTRSDLAPLPAEVTADELVAWKQRELLGVAARDLLGNATFEASVAAISSIAKTVLAAATRLADAEQLAVVAMGKLGGNELNYGSDVDIVLVGPDGGEVDVRSARRVLAIAGRSWPIDTALRPEGRDGPLVRTVESFAAHWDRWAEPWEFQALLKARPVAGDATLGARFIGEARERLWNRPFTATDLRAVRLMKERTEASVAPRPGDGEDVKRCRGGIRDIDFATQLLQLVHGRHDPDLRVRGTVPALAALADGGYIDAPDASWLRWGYRFLRRVEHALQLDREGVVTALPEDDASRRRLAHSLGFREEPRRPAATQLDRELGACRSTVRQIHERLYFRPLLEAFARITAPLNPEAATDRLLAFGFADGDRTRQAVRELTSGLTRSSKLMQQTLPLVLDWLSVTPDPDGGLLALRQLATGATRTTELAAAFRDSPETARRLATVLGTSRKLGSLLVRNPDMIDTLGASDAFADRSLDELLAAAGQAVDLRSGADARRRALHRFTDREGLRIGAHDVLSIAAPTQVGPALSNLATAAVTVAEAEAEVQVPFAVLAVGRFGGAELSYASDLDLLFVRGGSGPDAQREAERGASRLHRFLVGEAPANLIYDIDLDLRPEGRNGPLVRSVDGYRAYFERWAHVWERQAMVRARFVAGDAELGRQLLDALDPLVWTPLSADDRRELRRMKARIEAERLPPGDDPTFHLKLGPGALADVEFCTQLLQLEHGVRGAGTIVALEALAEAGVLPHIDAAVLVESHRFCARTRDRWFLVRGVGSDALPSGDDLSRLALSLGTSGTALREDYRRVTRRARRVVERRFYGVH